MARILPGQPLADQILAGLKVPINNLAAKRIIPHLMVILVGDNPASAAYISLKKRRAEQLGIKVSLKSLPSIVAEEQLLALIRSINQDPAVHGILIQLPLPSRLNRDKVVWAIQAKKDVDGFQMREFLPPGPMAIIELLKYYGISVTRKKVVVVGAGFLIGRPLSVLLNRFGSRVTVIESESRLTPRRTQEAEIIILATGQGGLIGKDYVREGQIVVDAGGEWVEEVKNSERKFIGEVVREEVEPVVKALVPNPGGIGPVTVALLLRNVVTAAKRSVLS